MTNRANLAPSIGKVAQSPAAKALATVMAVAAQTYVSHEYLPRNPSQGYSVFVIIFAAITLWAGKGFGYFAVGLSALSAAYFLLEGQAFAVSDPVDALGLIGMIAAGLFTVTVIAHLKNRLGERIEQTQALKTDSASKSDLLSEFMHRVSNDLTALTSLSQFLGVRAAHDETRDALDEMNVKIRLFASLYQRLRIDQPKATMDMPSFLHALCHDLVMAHVGLRPISFVTSFSPYTMPAGQALTLGLILNEEITNALKYAFPDDMEGRIWIALEPDPAAPNTMQLTVTDNGVGFVETDPPKGSGMGLKLVKSMASQLNGSHSLERHGNLTISRVRFAKSVQGMLAGSIRK